MPISRQEFEQQTREFNERADKLRADLDLYEAKYGAPPVTDWEDVEQLTNVIPWCEVCQSNHYYPDQCDPDDDSQRFPR